MTQRTCIAIVDATRARLFVHDRSSEADGVHDNLTERTDLVNPSRRLTANELFSDPRTGSNVAAGHHFGFDDHCDTHLANMDDEFARAAVAQIWQLVTETASRRLVVCASPRMLGRLRGAMANHPHGDVVILELPRDLVKLTRSELREELVLHAMLPPIPDRGPTRSARAK